MLHFNWNRPSPHCSRVAETFYFRLIRIHSNAGNSISLDLTSHYFHFEMFLDLFKWHVWMENAKIFHLQSLFNILLSLKIIFFSLVQKWVAHLVCQTSAGRISTVVQWNIWSKFECRGGTVFYQTTKVQVNWLVLAVNLSQRKSFNLFFSMGSGLTGSPEDIIVIITISNFFISCTTIYWISLPFMIAFLGVRGLRLFKSYNGAAICIFHDCLKWRGMEKFRTLTLKTRRASLWNRRLGQLWYWSGVSML